jgi:hypothetical protein
MARIAVTGGSGNAGRADSPAPFLPGDLTTDFGQALEGPSSPGESCSEGLARPVLPYLGRV